MQFLTLTTPIAAALLLVPALVLAGLGLLASAPGEWGMGALVAWTSLAAALVAGAALQAGAGPLPWLALVLAFAAMMMGGPPGLVVAALAVLALLALGAALPAPRWLLLALAVPPVVVAVRQYFG